MKFFNFFKNLNFKNFFRDLSKNKFILLICILFSIILWFFVIIFNSDSYSVVRINNIAINTDLSNTQAEQLGLSVVEVNPTHISVDVKGPRNKIVFLTSEDFVVNFKSFKNIKSSGKYSLEVDVSLKKPQQKITIEKISSDVINFVVDVLETKVVDVTYADDAVIDVEDGYIKDEVLCQPKSLTVSGPKKEIEKLSAIKLYINENIPNVLNRSKNFKALAKFVSQDGSFFKDESIFKYNLDNDFYVTVPVYKVKKIPLTVLYKNVPESFNLNLLKPKISPSHIEIGGSEEDLENINQINLGYVNLKELDSEKNKNFKFTVPPGIKNLNQISNANVSFEGVGLYYKFFDVKGVDLLNIPKKYDVLVKSKIIKDVKIVGLKEYLKNIDSSNISATIDFANIKIKKGLQNVPVKIEIINKDGVWPVGDYKCLISVK